MKFKNISKQIFAGLIGLSLFACDLEKTNIDPDNPTDSKVNFLLPSTQGGLAYVQGGDLGRYTNMFTQHLAGVGRQHLIIGRNQITESDVDNAWRFNLYPIMSNLNIIIDKAKEGNSPHYSGVAKVLMANALGLTADAWGDVPFSDAFKGTENIRPKFDPQESIYNTIQRLLDEAIVELNATQSTLSPASDDLIYAGNRTKWRRAAYALKARYHNHRSKRNASGSATDALAALNNGLTSNADDMQFNFGQSQTTGNPYFQFEDQRGDVVMGKFFVDLMKSINDPRLSRFASPTSTGAFVGATAGTNEVGSAMGDFYASTDSPVPFITFAEQKFIEAEAQLRLNNPSAAATAFNAAVKASILKVTGAANPVFEAVNANETAATITLQKIMRQKYIAMYSQMESWTDYRRTGFPVLPQAQNTSDVVPRRFPYPISERLYNEANLPVGLKSKTDRVWWDQ